MKTLGPLVTRTNTDVDFALPLRVLQPTPAAPQALLVLLHGVGGNETQLASLAAAVADDVLVVMPQGPITLGPHQFAWFRVAFTPQGPQIDAPAADLSRQTLIRLLAQLQQAHGIPARRTVIAGFSQGGILSASVGLSAPDHVAGFGLLSGRILPELAPHLADAARLATVQGFISHGVHDGKLPLFWAERAHAWLDQLGVPHTLHTYPADHEFSPAMARDFLTWFDQIRTTSN